MTLKSVPSALQADRDAGVVTLTWLLQVVATDGTVLGTSGLDRDVVLDTGDTSGPFAGLGEITYLRDPGFEATEIESANDLSVDGGDGFTLVPIDATPLTPEDVRAGKWDNARFRVLEVNYEALDHGFDVLHEGYWGNVTLRDNALLVIQLDGLTRPLRQNLCPVTSKTCRAPFGSQESEEVEFCGYDVEPLWVEFTVTEVDPDDSLRAFTASGLAGASGAYFPGAVIFDTGANAGVFAGVESHEAGGIVSVRTAMPRPIQVGDTGRIRPDCTKRVEGERGCRSYWGDDWALHFMGEPDMDTTTNATTPGARLGPGGRIGTPGVEMAPE